MTESRKGKNMDRGHITIPVSGRVVPNSVHISPGQDYLLCVVSMGPSF